VFCEDWRRPTHKTVFGLCLSHFRVFAAANRP
jgi:hypothetical protein